MTDSEAAPVANRIAGRFAEIAAATADLVARLTAHVDRLADDARRDSKAVANTAEALWTAAALKINEISGAVSSSPRVARIVRELVPLVARYRFAAARRPHIAQERADAELQKLHEHGARAVYELCVELRGGVLKVGQIMASRADLLPRAYIEQLSKLEDQVPAVDTELIVAKIERELEGTVDELFGSFELEPIAAASLAQVHRATLPTGETVAVKVQVPGIDDVLRADVAAIALVTKLLAGSLPIADLGSVRRELARALEEELDFVREAQSAAEFRAAFVADDRIVVPRVFPSHSTAKVLTLEYVEGERLRSFLDRCAADGEPGAKRRDQLFETLIDNYCAQILAVGLFHGDPHPGNFLVCADGRLTVLDFGCTRRFSVAERAAYAKIAQAAVTKDLESLAANLSAVGFRSRDPDGSALLEMADMMLQGFGESGRLDQLPDPREQLERAIALARENPLVEVPESFVLLGRVFAVLGGLVMHYKPAISPFPLLLKHLSTALQTDTVAAS